MTSKLIELSENMTSDDIEVPEGHAAIEVGMSRRVQKELLMLNIATAAKEGPDQTIIDMLYQIALFCEMGSVAMSSDDIMERYRSCLAVAVEQAPEVMKLLEQSIAVSSTKH